MNRTLKLGLVATIGALLGVFAGYLGGDPIWAIFALPFVIGVYHGTALYDYFVPPHERFHVRLRWQGAWLFFKMTWTLVWPFFVAGLILNWRGLGGAAIPCLAISLVLPAVLMILYFADTQGGGDNKVHDMIKRVADLEARHRAWLNCRFIYIGLPCQLIAWLARGWVWLHKFEGVVCAVGALAGIMAGNWYGDWPTAALVGGVAAVAYHELVRLDWRGLLRMLYTMPPD